MAWIYCRHRETVGGGRCGWAGPQAPWARGMPRAGWAGCPTPVLPCAQDSAHEQGAYEPPWVRALCLRGMPRKRPNAQPPAAGPDPGGGFTACPAHPYRPAQPAITQSRFGFGFGLCRCRAQPCRTTLRCARRARPGATRNEKAAFRRLLHYFSLISRRRSSRKPWAVIGSGYRLGFSGVMHEGSTSIRKSGFGCRKNGTE